MSVDIRLLGIFKDAYGSDKASLELGTPMRLRELIAEMARLSPEVGRVLIDPELLDPRPNAVILVNGKEINVLEGLETEIKEGDQLVLIPVTHGG